jgi:ParB/Sulfiredoxin domain
MTTSTATTLEPPLSQHPISAVFPAMSDEDFAALVTDIKTHGQRLPIMVYDDQVLDGWHRYRACLELGITPTFEEFTGRDPVAFVLSMNLQRRHLTESQRAMIAADLAQVKGRPSKKSGRVRPLSNKAAARALKIGPTSVKSAKAVLKYGTPKLVAAVKAGTVSVAKAAKQVRATQKAQAPIPTPMATAAPITVPPRAPRRLPEVGQYGKEFDKAKKTVQALNLAALSPEGREIVVGFVLNQLRKGYAFADRTAFLRALAAAYTEVAAIDNERWWKSAPCAVL